MHGHAPPPGYVCHKCNVPGHFISECEHGGRGRGRGGGGGGYRGGGGGGGPITSEHDYAVPFPDAAGRWVARKDFPRNRKTSFGMFECHRCSKTWSSAHAQPLYHQGCKNCDDYVLPCCMWLNLNPPGDTRESDDDDSRAPHDHERCEACRAGVCAAGLRFVPHTNMREWVASRLKNPSRHLLKLREHAINRRAEVMRTMLLRQDQQRRSGATSSW